MSFHTILHKIALSTLILIFEVESSIFTLNTGYQHNTQIVILNGGLSGRMKTSKAFLLDQNGISFIESILNVYMDAGLRNFTIISNSIDYIKINQLVSTMSNIYVTILRNDFPEKGRIFSLKMGLTNCSSSDFIFIQNIDNPSIDRKLISNLYKNKKVDKVVVSVFNHKKGHPILLGKKVIDAFLNEATDDFNFRDFIFRIPIVEVESINESILLNINTEEDYQHYINQNLKNE